MSIDHTRVLLVSHSGEMAGAEFSLLELATRLDPEIYATVVAVPHDRPLANVLSSKGIETAFYSTRWWCSLSDNMDPEVFMETFCQLPDRVFELVDIIKSRNIDVVVTNTCVVGEGALAACLTNLPHIFYIREMIGETPMLSLFTNPRSFTRLLGALSSKILVVSEAVGELYRKYSGRNDCLTIYNGIEEMDIPKTKKKELYGTGCDEPAILCVAELSKRKGIEYLIDAFEQVISTARDARLFIVGRDGDAGNELRNIVSTKPFQRSVAFLGEREDARELIANADVVVLPSVVDSFPRVVMEAMALGTPVVATKSGGAMELVLHGVTGYLVDICNPKALADAIVEMLSDEKKLAQMGRSARERVRNEFSISKQMRKFEDVLDMAITGKDADRGYGDLVAAVLKVIADLQSEREKLTGERFELNEMLHRLRRHPVIGTVWKSWEKIVNPNVSITPPSDRKTNEYL